MKFPEQFRAAGMQLENGGAFTIPFEGRDLFVVASNGMGWDHVSVSLKNRCPNWREMCHIKSLFWDDNECVMQLHPAKDNYINYHEFCLHLWRPQTQVIPLPPIMLV